MDLSEYGTFYTEYELTSYNSYKIKAICKYFILIDDVNKLVNLIKLLKEKKCKYLVIGGGSNIILPSYYTGVVIKLNFNDLIINDINIEIGAAYYLNKLAIETVNLGLQGLEWAAGIPGTIGGSIVGNAGAYGSEIGNWIEKIDVIENDEVKTLYQKDIKFTYRHSDLRDKKTIVIKAYLKLNKGDKAQMLNTIKENMQKRMSTQPLEYPSCGSIFRNPENHSAGKLIEDSNLKGYAIGGAKVSEKHANFIINYKNATSEDIVNLINYVHKKVLENYNIDLVVEPEIIS